MLEPVDHAPTFPATETGVRTVAENTPPGMDIGDPFTATDDDGHVLTYFLLDSPDAESFGLDESTGQLRTKAPLDYETKRLYTMTVAVYDSGEEHGDDDRSADATLAATVIVTDVYESPPPSICITGGAVEDSEDNAGLVSDCEALLLSRDAFAGDVVLNWSTDIPMADWEGVAVQGTPDRVTGLYLNSKGLNGAIPPALLYLTGLKSIYLHDNELRGLVPNTSTLVDLERLWLNGNGLTGFVPDISRLPDTLTQLNLHSNRLVGGIPPSLGELSELEGLWLHRNRLTGEIPSQLGNLSNLKWLWLYGTQLEGGIPPQLGDISSLAHLNLHSNQLSGEIPTSLSQLSELKGLWLHRNGLTGEIPARLGDLSNLERLSLYANQLSGEIPWVLSDLTRLERLYLHHNELTGGIPAELGQLSNLTNLWLNGNRLTGTIPNELGALSNLERWRIRDNQFTGCVPEGMASVEDSDLQSLGLEVC